MSRLPALDTRAVAARSLTANRVAASPSRGDTSDEPKQAWGTAGRGQHDAIRRLGWR